MLAGTIARLQHPVDSLLEDHHRGGALPALSVEQTQTRVDDPPVQAGSAATTIETQAIDAMVLEDTDTPGVLHTEQVASTTTIVADWVADVTGTGLVVASTTDGDDRWAFPYGLVANQTGERLDRLEIDVTQMHAAWSSDDDLGDVWMTGASDDDDATQIQYHDAADIETRPTIGMGFTRPWGGTVVRGIVYQSGYVAIYSAETPATFIGFLEECILPYVEAHDGEMQSTLSEVS